MSFFPDNLKDLNKSNSRYTRLDEGNTKLRFLAEPTWGFELWTDGDSGREVHRVELTETFDKDLLSRSEQEPKLFCAAKVYNYNTKAVEVWTFTQKQIIDAIKGWSENDEYGDPLGYDLVVNRIGLDRNTKYQVMANPPKPLSKEVQEASEAEVVECEQLFTGGSPFVSAGK